MKPWFHQLPAHGFTPVHDDEEIAGHFDLPCCGARVELIRKKGSDMKLWSGIECPKKCKPVRTYSFELALKDGTL